MSVAATAPADLRLELEAGLAALGLSLRQPAVEQLLGYVALLSKWNRVYNLTAIREPQLMVSHHLLDSLAVAPHLPLGRLLDVGTGGGLPGIPLAIANPGRSVTLLDSNHKKTAFVRQAATELKLANVEVVCDRAESWRPDSPFDVVVSRAFAGMDEFVRVTRHAVAPGGVWAAMKGVHPADELRALPPGVCPRDVISLRVPGVDAERHLVLLERT